MGLVVCPHCKSHRLVTSKLHKDVIVVMSCPECQELSVIFQDKVVALDKQILAQGSFDERKDHIAHVIAEFIQSGAIPFFKGFAQLKPDNTDAFGPLEIDEVGEDPSADPITRQEIERFAQVDLKCIDDPAYFKKHFG